MVSVLGYWRARKQNIGNDGNLYELEPCAITQFKITAAHASIA